METEETAGTTSLSRRGFLGAAAGTAAAGAMGPFAGTTLAKPKKPKKPKGPRGYDADKGDIKPQNVGMQIYTIRGLIGGNLDLDGSFEMLADAGYKTVEVGGTYDGRSPEDFRELAKDHKLRVVASHVPGGHGAFRNDLETVLDDAETLGLDYVGIAFPDAPRTVAGYQAMAEEFNTYGEAAKARGIKFYFHNHPDDFTIDNGTCIYDVLLEETDPKLVWFEMDIAWVVAGGQNPRAYLKDAQKRFPLFHVKDLRFAEDGPRTTPPNVVGAGRNFDLTAVGKGEIDFAKIFKVLKKPNDHEYFVEDDDAPDPNRNPAGESNTAWVSREHIANLKL